MHQSKELQEFVAVLLRHQTPLRGYIVSLMPGSSDTEDVLQEVNIVLWEKRQSFTLGTNFQAWAFAVARNMVKAQLRNHKRSLSPSKDEALIQAIDTLWHQKSPQSCSSKQQALERCLSKLRQEERDLIQVRYTKGTNLEAYATKINRSAASLRTTLSRVRAKLRSCVTKRLALEGGLA